MPRRFKFANKIILIYVLLLVFFPIAKIYAQLPENREPFFVSELEPEEIVLIGRIIEGKGDLMYNGSKTNEFVLVSGCNNYGGILPLARLKSRLPELSDEQVIIYGAMKKIDMAHLLKENPTSECVLNLSFSRQYYLFLEARKIEPVVFYEPDLPGRIEPDKPLSINILVRNPFKERIGNIQLRVSSANDAYQPFERWIDLAPGENKVIPAVLELRKAKLAREEGSEIQLILQGYTKQKKANYLLLFREIIASYNSEGLLEER